MSQINFFDEIIVDNFAGGGGASTAKSEREYFRSRAAFFSEVAGAMDKVISVEGYKAFRGTMKIQPKTAAVPAFELSGDWLYKPETGCWYGKGSSFPEDICTIMEVMQ